MNTEQQKQIVDQLASRAEQEARQKHPDSAAMVYASVAGNLKAALISVLWKFDDEVQGEISKYLKDF